MGSSETIFRLCLKQDLRRLHQIVKTISNTCESQEVTSWFFPTKSHRFVEDFIKDNDILEKGSERLFLELIIDRIHVGIKLILEQIPTKYLGKFVFRPKQVTLGYLFENLFQGISKMKSMKSYQLLVRDKENDIIMLERETQTDIVALHKCDSCASAIECMKNLMKLFGHKEFEYLNHGKRLKPQIIDVTQFGCMLQTTTSMMSSFRKLSGNVHRHADEIRGFRLENERLISECVQMRRKVTHLEEEVKVM